ncbi:hypothetical protein ACVW1A_006065 [Bradyrhizobium sp. LB1.3]
MIEATAPMSWSSRGSTDAGPAPRQTFTVGTSWRMLLHAQRSSGKLRNEPFWKLTVRSGAGGKPFIQPRVSGSVSVAVAGAGDWLGSAAVDMKAGSRGDAAVVARGRATETRRLCKATCTMRRRYFSGRKSSATVSCSGTSGKKLSRWQ